MCVGKTLNMGSCSKFWGNLEGIWGNPGEIPHIGWKIPGVYRVNILLIRREFSIHWNKKKRKKLFIEDFELANSDPKGEYYQSANSSL